uniref:Uncharacterized protein n=1 Tax=Daphnia galeata TaxID=27404 RepID=A0A8J2WJB9_9CRUS|nr:unnamed protein product [Daphnia galeata]
MKTMVLDSWFRKKTYAEPIRVCYWILACQMLFLFSPLRSLAKEMSFGGCHGLQELCIAIVTRNWFKDVDLRSCLGHPRKEGMERNDLLAANGQGVGSTCKEDVKVLVCCQSCNTNY